MAGGGPREVRDGGGVHAPGRGTALRRLRGVHRGVGGGVEDGVVARPVDGATAAGVGDVEVVAGEGVGVGAARR